MSKYLQVSYRTEGFQAKYWNVWPLPKVSKLVRYRILSHSTWCHGCGNVFGINLNKFQVGLLFKKKRGKRHLRWLCTFMKLMLTVTIYLNISVVHCFPSIWPMSHNPTGMLHKYHDANIQRSRSVEKRKGFSLSGCL